MAPPSVLEPPPARVAEREGKKFRPASAYPPVEPRPESHRYEMFSEALLEMSTSRPRKRTMDFIVSFLVHFAILGIAILLPLYFTETIDLKQFSSALLVAPPPPPPPPPAAPVVVRVAPVRRVFMSSGRLVSPVVIPEKVAMLKEEDLPPDVGGGVGVVGGVPGGVPGGQMGGVIGGIIGGIPGTSLPLPPKAAPKAPIRVGGRVREPRPVATPPPVYSPLARQAKIQGDVVIDAVIDTSGNVVEMKVVSGHPLLIQSAVNALRQWKYEPTYLNDEPVPVALFVTIRFRLD